MSASWSTFEALRNDPAFVAQVEAAFAEEDEKRAEREAICSEGAGGVRGEAPHFTCTPANNFPQGPPRAVIPNDPIPWPEVTAWSGTRARLRKTYMNRGLPTLSREGVDRETIEHAEGLEAAGLSKKAQRLVLCMRLGDVWECSECGRAYKVGWGCGLRSCPDCGSKNFDRVFARLLQIEPMIPRAIRTQAGWGWKILDYTFWHHGEFPARDELKKMRGVIARVTKRAVMQLGGKNGRNYRRGRGCRLKLDVGGVPVLRDEWPVGLTKEGEERILQGWAVVKTGETKKMIRACMRCGKRVLKDRVSKAWTCRQCGKIEWFEYEHKETSTVRWRLRFGWIQIAVSEFGYNKQTGSPNCNYHFHTAFFGPFVPQMRLIELFREESLKALGVESRGVKIADASDGFHSVLAHALKYTEKIPASTPAGRAQYEIVLHGVRRFAVSGLLQGVPLPKAVEKKDCPDCNFPMEKTLRMIPLSELEELPILLEGKKARPALARGDHGRDFLDFDADGLCRVRAPC